MQFLTFSWFKSSSLHVLCSLSSFFSIYSPCFSVLCQICVPLPSFVALVCFNETALKFCGSPACLLRVCIWVHLPPLSTSKPQQLLCHDNTHTHTHTMHRQGSFISFPVGIFVGTNGIFLHLFSITHDALHPYICSSKQLLQKKDIQYILIFIFIYIIYMCFFMHLDVFGWVIEAFKKHTAKRKEIPRKVQQKVVTKHVTARLSKSLKLAIVHLT